MGQRCPYAEHEPLTDAGWQAWDVILRCSGQLRLASHAGIVIGIDMSAALAIGAALGHDVNALADPRIQSAGLPAAEAGLVAAINTRLSEEP